MKNVYFILINGKDFDYVTRTIFWGENVEERDIYKYVLKKVINQTEKLQINNVEELIQKLITELKYHDLPKYNSNMQ